MELTTAVGGVAVNIRLGCVVALLTVALVSVQEVIDQVRGDRCVADVAGTDFGVGDDLAVRIGRDMALVAVEPGVSDGLCKELRLRLR